jgi:cytochrome c
MGAKPMPMLDCSPIPGSAGMNIQELPCIALLRASFCAPGMIRRRCAAEPRAGSSAIHVTIRRFLLAVIVAGGAWSATGPARAQDATAGAAVFKSQCSICHSPQAGRNLVGPSLFDVVGRPAGKVPGFHYSPANRDSGLTWDAATLDRYLTSPGAVVPHTIMTYGGLKDAKKRADLIAYLTSLH